MNFGNWIILSFVLFAGLIGTLVFVCMKQDLNLVAADYYDKELAYQQRFDSKMNANRLVSIPKIDVLNDREVRITFRDLPSVSTGEVLLYRPSNSALDRRLVLSKTADSVQYFDLKDLQRGLYSAQMSWTMDNKNYFLEQRIFVGNE